MLLMNMLIINEMIIRININAYAISIFPDPISIYIVAGRVAVLPMIIPAIIIVAPKSENAFRNPKAIDDKIPLLAIGRTMLTNVESHL